MTGISGLTVHSHMGTNVPVVPEGLNSESSGMRLKDEHWSPLPAGRHQAGSESSPPGYSRSPAAAAAAEPAGSALRGRPARLGTLAQATGDEARGQSLRLHPARLRLDLRRNFFTETVIKH